MRAKKFLLGIRIQKAPGGTPEAQEGVRNQMRVTGRSRRSLESQGGVRNQKTSRGTLEIQGSEDVRVGFLELEGPESRGTSRNSRKSNAGDADGGKGSRIQKPSFDF